MWPTEYGSISGSCSTWLVRTDLWRRLLNIHSVRGERWVWNCSEHIYQLVYLLIRITEHDQLDLVRMVPGAYYDTCVFVSTPAHHNMSRPLSVPTMIPSHDHHCGGLGNTGIYSAVPMPVAGGTSLTVTTPTLSTLTMPPLASTTHGDWPGPCATCCRPGTRPSAAHGQENAGILKGQDPASEKRQRKCEEVEGVGAREKTACKLYWLRQGCGLQSTDQFQEAARPGLREQTCGEGC